MTKKSDIDDFLKGNHYAVCGVSLNAKKFSSMIYNKMKELNYNVYPVNPKYDNIDKIKVYPDILSLPELVDRTIIISPPETSLKLIKDSVAKGINLIWIQQGAESKESIDFAKNNPNVKIIYGQCFWMYLSPNGFPHNLHKGILKILGKYPK